MNLRPKIDENSTKNRRKNVEKTKPEKDDKKDMNFEPVLAMEREARLFVRRDPSVATVRKLCKRQSLRSLARCARSLAALDTQAIVK